MVQLAPTLQLLKEPYIFPLIEQKLIEVRKTCPDRSILNFGVGDIALPLASSLAEALSQATREMTTMEGKRGYGPACGYSFLRQAVANHFFKECQLTEEEIFISDGINRDITEMQELFSKDIEIGIIEPTYPAYFKVSKLSGRKNIHLLPCIESCDFLPQPPEDHCDLLYLCSPNNPTGVAMDRTTLQKWIDYARAHEALILLDAAYAAFITSPDVPKHIYELDGAKECVIAFYSFSKSAGFTGLRCGFTVIPKALKVHDGIEKIPLGPLWEQRQEIKCNGIAYPIQRTAEAAMTPQGQKETETQIASYRNCAHYLKQGLDRLGFSCWGGKDSPYIWWKTDGRSSWAFFEWLLERVGILSIPGTGFGTYGEGFVRLSTFQTEDCAKEAITRISSLRE